MGWGSAINCYMNENEFIIEPRCRSEVKGSREICYYNEKNNLFKIFITEWMFINNYYITEKYIYCAMSNNSNYKYLSIDKNTGESVPLESLSEDLFYQYEDNLKNIDKRDIYDYKM